MMMLGCMMTAALVSNGDAGNFKAAIELVKKSAGLDQPQVSPPEGAGNAVSDEPESEEEEDKENTGL
jgi:hypothetical protein